MTRLLRVETIQSRFVNPYDPKFPNDYRRVVTVSSSAGNVACAFTSKRPTATEEWSTTEAFDDGTQAFASRWLAKRDPESDHDLHADAAQYNCRVYALAATRGKHESPFFALMRVSGTLALRRARPIGDLNEPLPFGTHVVLRDVENRNPVHSSVAIGIGPGGEHNTNDPTDQLQVFDHGGNLGVASLESSVRYHRDELGIKVEALAVRL